eukprot:4252947-Prymnesium_polylepis.1
MTGTFAQKEAAAWKALQLGGLNATAREQPALAAQLDRIAAALDADGVGAISPSAEPNNRIIGLHLRGTDKQCSLGGAV